MPEASLLYGITPVPVLSVIVWLVLSLLVLYLARRPFHATLQSIGEAVNHLLRTLATTIKLFEGRLNRRNRAVLSASGRQVKSIQLEGEFFRLSQALQDGLAGYPNLQRKVRDLLQMLENDYRCSEDVPQGLSDWVRVIDAVAAIEPPGDPMVATILENIHDTLQNQHRTALDEYRKSISRRHSILSRMSPRWRKIDKRLTRLETILQGLTERTDSVDRSIDAYEALCASPDQSHSRLYTSALTRFCGSSLALAVFAVGAVLNFNLVALPMVDMVGGNSLIGPFRTADVAGGFLVGMVLVAGVLLMDTLRITHFFHPIHALDDRKRTWLLASLVVILVALSGIEASLAVLRDRMVADAEALRQSLGGIDPPTMPMNGIATVCQAVLGFILPLFMVTAAIPLESFLVATRTVVGTMVAWGLRIGAITLRLGGTLAQRLSRMVSTVYDLTIFPILWLEARMAGKWPKSVGRTTEHALTPLPDPAPSNPSDNMPPCNQNND